MAPTILSAGLATILLACSCSDAAAAGKRNAVPTQYYTAPDGGYYTSTQYYTSKQYYTPAGQSSAHSATSSAAAASSSTTPTASSSSHDASPSGAAPSSSSLTGKDTSSSSSSSSGSCPSVWSEVASDLTSSFSGCNDLARSAIRFAFHDAAGFSSTNAVYAPASGGADGSLLLNDQEISRTTESPMKEKYRDPYLLPLYYRYKFFGVGAADLVQFAGAVGVKTCTGGPTVPVVVGRKDSSTAAPEGTLPAAFGQGSDYESLIQLWGDKGISPRELAALIGAHTVSRAYAQQANGIPPGSSQDSDPTVWDNHYFSQTQSQTTAGVYSFDSDKNLSNATTECGAAFTAFAADSATWLTEFSAAMQKLSLLGISQSTIAGFTDCTSMI